MKDWGGTYFFVYYPIYDSSSVILVFDYMYLSTIQNEEDPESIKFFPRKICYSTDSKK